MTSSNTREAVRRSTQEHAGRNLIRVYNELTGQDRWVGVAYEPTGGIVATASRGTIAATRAALARASRRLASGAPPRPEGPATLPSFEEKTRRKDLRRHREAVSLLRAP